MPQFTLSRWLYLRLLGVIYLMAFASLAVQIVGLVGGDGLLPAATYLDSAGSVYGARAWYYFPTLAWISTGDTFLRALCWGGAALSVAAIVGVAPRLTFLGLWALYLSITVVGQSFLSFQWDVLLLEAGLIAWLYAPGGWWPHLAADRAPHAGVRWLLWGLAFKLTVLSGVTKLVSGDPTWRDGTALSYHYMTQPLPVWTSWYVYHWPVWFHRATTVSVFFVELVVAFTILLPPRLRRLRAAGCVLLCGLQVGIGVTGNYGFFNLLTVVLYLAMLDDGMLERLGLRTVAARAGGEAAHGPETRPWRVGLSAAAALLGLLSLTTLWREATYTSPHPVANRILGWVAPFRSVNGYGLFRTMTTERPEIVVEGSRDGDTWLEYSFRWKPGPLDRRPTFVEPHMPRLDWQMWFAALSPAREQEWLVRLVYALLEGSPAVLDLLDGNPFADAPPRFVRLSLYDYRFTTADEAARSGDWWHRELLGELLAPVSLDAGGVGSRSP